MSYILSFFLVRSPRRDAPEETCPSRSPGRDSWRLLFGLLGDIELKFDLPLPVIGLEPGVVQFGLQGVDVCGLLVRVSDSPRA